MAQEGGVLLGQLRDDLLQRLQLPLSIRPNSYTNAMKCFMHVLRCASAPMATMAG